MGDSPITPEADAPTYPVGTANLTFTEILQARAAEVITRDEARRPLGLAVEANHYDMLGAIIMALRDHLRDDDEEGRVAEQALRNLRDAGYEIVPASERA